MIRARILGHDGQTLVKEMVIEEPLPYLRVALPNRAELYQKDQEIALTGNVFREALAYYERTDGGGTRIYRLKVNL